MRKSAFILVLAAVMISVLLCSQGCSKWRHYNGDGTLAKVFDTSTINRVQLGTIDFAHAGRREFRLEGLPRGRYFVGLTDYVYLSVLEENIGDVSIVLYASGKLVAHIPYGTSMKEWSIGGGYLSASNLRSLSLDGRQYELVVEWKAISTPKTPSALLEIVFKANAVF